MLDLPSIMQRSLLVALLTPGWGLASECFPTPDSKKPQYLVAYGSLLYEESRLRKVQQAKLELPVWVEGYKRGWLLRTKPDSLKLTRLGVTPSAGDKFNGVLLSMEVGKLTSLDRQAKLECRTQINKDSLKAMNDKALPDGDFWIYQAQKKYISPPAGEYPIMQTNVDVFLTGCMEQAERFKIKDFADICLSTTKNWSMHWANDRRSPIDQKIVQTKNKQVDRLLEKLEGDLFENVRAN
ncbi:hypothetical protein ACH42_10465 [Endozoicomonas sp. (ex Bugula neritina AB1)]|nr:hypothetical protein ACH42_10465 [Endozoicomonas sp. (ex Bugula neritina AB1)]